MTIMYKKYKMQDYYNAMNLPFTENFGWSEDKTASWFVKQPGAQAVMNSYGVNKSNLLSTYIPELKKRLKGGYVLFLMITVTEGGGAGNWLNHYPNDTKPTGLGCLIDDCDYITGQIWVNTYPPATTDPYGGYNQPFTEDKPGEMNRYYTKEMKPRTFGEYIIPATLAGNARIWGEKWCNANNVYFGNPVEDIMGTLKKSGVDWNNPANSKPPTGEANDGSGSSNNFDIGQVTNVISDEVKKALDKVVKEIQDKLTIRQYGLNVSELSPNIGASYKNNFFTTVNLGGNSISVRFTPDLNKIMDKMVKDAISAVSEGLINKLAGLNLPGSGEGDGWGHGSKPNGPSGKPSTKPGTDEGKAVIAYCKRNVGRVLDGDGIYPGQCADLPLRIDIDLFGSKMKKAGWLNGNAIDMYYGAKASGNKVEGWKIVEGAPFDDAKAKQIWNSLPDGSIMFTTNASWPEAGHVAVKSGPWAKSYQQNYNTDGNGGPVRNEDLSYWLTYNGFVGAFAPIK